MISSGIIPSELDALCVLGRGIEIVRTKQGCVWRPTRFIETPNEDGSHSGHRAASNEDDDSSLVAGANATLVAASQLFAEVAPKDRPRLVIFAAGRPQYLAKHPDPDLTEGRVLAEVFMRRIGSAVAARLEVVILSSNRDTQDDIRELRSLAVARSVRQAGIITVSVHLRRAIEFARRVGFSHDIDLFFIPAEALLLRRYATRPLVAQAIQQIPTSKAFSRTAAREEKGLAASKSGTYQRVQHDR
jgi:hypothetical protein